jgi:hypothetical protein
VSDVCHSETLPHSTRPLRFTKGERSDRLRDPRDLTSASPNKDKATSTLTWHRHSFGHGPMVFSVSNQDNFRVFRGEIQVKSTKIFPVTSSSTPLIHASKHLNISLNGYENSFPRSYKTYPNKTPDIPSCKEAYSFWGPWGGRNLPVPVNPNGASISAKCGIIHPTHHMQNNTIHPKIT